MGSSQIASSSWFMMKNNAFNYMGCTFGMVNKKYEIKNLITIVTNVISNLPTIIT
jgi:hypothetical protein